MITRRHMMRMSAGSALAPAFLSGAALAQTWPTRFVRLVVPFAAGGPTDFVSRILSERLSSLWGQQLVIENRGGAGTNIGAELVARANPDGYTLLLGSSTQAVNRSLYRTLGYDIIADFAPISLLCTVNYYLTVPIASPAKSVAEFIAYAKERAGKLTYATPGPGTTPHLCAELFKRLAGIDMIHVPYRGAALALTDLIAGRVDAVFMSGVVLQNIRAGQVRGLAVSGPARTAVAPDLPPVAEAGVPGFDVVGWFALFAPARTPAEIIAKVNADTVASLADPGVNAKLEQVGYAVESSSPEELSRLVKSDIAKWGQLIKELGITVGD
jgi:tripartite-type tricarboxylate transporter receptor subunit TctC